MVPKPPGSATKASARGHHHLALVHRAHDREPGDAAVSGPAGREGLGQHAEDLPSVLEGGVGDGAHHSHLAASVHEFEAALGQRRAEAARGLVVRWIFARVSAAEDTDTLPR